MSNDVDTSLLFFVHDLLFKNSEKEVGNYPKNIYFCNKYSTDERFVR